jgi:Domain of unknown function (DUF4432)
VSVDHHRPQRNCGPRVRDVEYLGMRLVSLENELLRAGVLAGKGTDVIEFNYKPRDLDFAFLTPGGVRNPTTFLSTSPDPLATFVDTYPGGWQEIFPNGGAPATSLGASFGQHGEICNLPWDVRLDEEGEEAAAVSFAVRALKSPFRIEKTLRLESGKPTLFVNEVIENESDTTVPAMWGHHLAYGRPFLDETCRIRVPEGVTVIPHPVPIHPDGRRVKADQRPSWPFEEGSDGSSIDLSTVPPRGTINDWRDCLPDRLPRGVVRTRAPGQGNRYPGRVGHRGDAVPLVLDGVRGVQGVSVVWPALYDWAGTVFELSDERLA